MAINPCSSITTVTIHTVINPLHGLATIADVIGSWISQRVNSPNHLKSISHSRMHHCPKRHGLRRAGVTVGVPGTLDVHRGAEVVGQQRA